MSNLADHIKALVKQHGSYRKAEAETGINCSYLCRLAGGERVEPTDDVLRALGLERVVTYRKRK